MLRRNLKSKLFSTIGSLSVAGLMLAGVATVAYTVSSPRPARADQSTVPPVPTNIQVPTGNKVFLVGHGVGTQNYVCLASGSGFAWTLFTPQATLFGEDGGQVITHFFSPNPSEPNTNPRVVSPGGTIRVTWQHSRDGSTVWGQVKSGNAAVVDPNAIPWLLVTAVGAKAGPTGGDVLTATTFIQRLSTTGGLAKAADCSSSGDIGKQAFIPYTADYFFYKKAV